MFTKTFLWPLSPARAIKTGRIADIALDLNKCCEMGREWAGGEDGGAKAGAGCEDFPAVAEEAVVYQHRVIKNSIFCALIRQFNSAS
jgi:hypothetical protein